MKMKRKETIKTYGRHRMRVVAVEGQGWSSDDDKHKNVFSFSNSSLSSNESIDSYLQQSQRLTRSTRKQLLGKKINEENRYQRRVKKFTDFNSSDSDSDVIRKGLRDTTNRFTRNSVQKQSYVPKSTVKSTHKDQSYNFSELDDYSLIVDSDNSNKAKKSTKRNILATNNLLVPNELNVETSTPCRAASTKINNCDISQIEELEDSPVSCNSANSTAPKLNLSSISGSPSLDNNYSKDQLNSSHESKSELKDVSETYSNYQTVASRVAKRTRNQLSPSPISNRTRSIFDGTRSLFDSPDCSKSSKILRVGKDDNVQNKSNGITIADQKKLKCLVELTLLGDSFIAEKTKKRKNLQENRSVSLFDNSSSSSNKQSSSPDLSREAMDDVTEESEDYETEEEEDSDHHSFSIIEEEGEEENITSDDNESYEEDEEIQENEDDEDQIEEEEEEEYKAEEEDLCRDLETTRYALTELAILEENEEYNTEGDIDHWSTDESINVVLPSQLFHNNKSVTKHSLRVIGLEEQEADSYQTSDEMESDHSLVESYHTAQENSRPEYSRVTHVKTNTNELKPYSTPVSSQANLSRSFVEMLTPKQSNNSVQYSPRSKILSLCQKPKIISFLDCIPLKMLNKCMKIGEGVYGEVFRSSRNGHSVAIKVIPIEGDFKVNDEQQKTFEEVLPEVLISQELSDLRYNEECRTDNYCQVNSVACVKGCYPKQLLKQWDDYDEKKVSENDRPDIFKEDQLFIVFEFADGGCDLSAFQFDNPNQAKSVLIQTAYALAVAEESFEFEHRDLHIGNVLVKATEESTVDCTIDGHNVSIETNGVHVFIIDFTMSRLKKDGVVIHCNLADDKTLFEGEGDYQFDIYRLMKEHNGNKWDDFSPFSNILWLHYLTDCILKKKRFKSNTRVDREFLKDIRQLFKELLKYCSAKDLVLNSEFFNPR